MVSKPRRGPVSEQTDLNMNVRRIVVAVDESAHSRAALEAAVELAAQFGAELNVLFVEDINVLRIAQLPFVREVGQYSARGSRIEVTHIEERLRSRSRRIEATFQTLITRQSVHGTFHVVRGSVWTEIQAAAREADMLVVGRAGWSQVREHRLGSTARAVCCSDAPQVTAVLHKGKRISSPIVAIFDGSPVGAHALTLAGALTERWAGALRVLLLVGDADQLPQLRALIAAHLAPFDVKPEVLPVSVGYQTPSIAAELAVIIRSLEGRTLILPGRTPILRDQTLLDLIEGIDVPVLLVR
jgi:nucleotide-binding universal stress UspA family protein